MWYNKKEDQEKWVETYLVPYFKKWKEKNITISLSYYDGRLEDGSGRLTDIVICDKCGFKWKDNIYEPRECPNCNGLAEKRPNICENKSVIFSKNIIDKRTNKQLQKDEKIVYESLRRELNLTPNVDFLINYKRDWLLESDFYIPKLDINIECQGEQHFFPVDIKDDPNKTDDDRDLILINQVIRDIFKFNEIYNKRVLYYINSDNIRVDEYDFIDRAKKSINEALKRQILKNNIKKYISKKYITNISSIKNIYEYVSLNINDMYKKNRVFKSPIKLCETIKLYFNKN